jgi:short-subunit dehydrogenase
MIMSRFYLNRWAESRKGKKCAIVDYSSCVALQLPSPGIAEYSACKAYNRWLSRALDIEYRNNKLVDLDVLTVHPASVKSQMNSGRYTCTITRDQHAWAVINSLGWDSETHGHWNHGLRDFLLKYEPFYSINNYVNGKRRQEFIEEQRKLNEKKV